MEIRGIIFRRYPTRKKPTVMRGVGIGWIRCINFIENIKMG